MKYVRILVLFVVFLLILFTKNYFDKKSIIKEKNILKNGVYIKGRVKKTIVSNNHEFGIILIKVDTANVKEFVGNNASDFFPYKIKHGFAEVYTHVPYNIQIGTLIIINSDKGIVSYYNKKSQHEYDSEIFLVGNWDKKFIEKNTTIK